MNTNNPDILFFVRREYGTPSIELRAYKVGRTETDEKDIKKSAGNHPGTNKP